MINPETFCPNHPFRLFCVFRNFKSFLKRKHENVFDFVKFPYHVKTEIMKLSSFVNDINLKTILSISPILSMIQNIIC